MLYEIDDTLTHFEGQAIQKYMPFITSRLKLKENVFVTFARSEDTTGGCVELEDDEYLVEIPNKIPKEQLIKTIAHEMKHVEQYDRGALKQGELWNNKCYSSSPYCCKPWEIEAYEFEKNFERVL